MPNRYCQIFNCFSLLDLLKSIIPQKPISSQKIPWFLQVSLASPALAQPCRSPPNKEFSVDRARGKRSPTALPLALGSMTGKAAHCWSQRTGAFEKVKVKNNETVYFGGYACVSCWIVLALPMVISLTLKNVATVLLCWRPVFLFPSVASSTYWGNMMESTVCEDTEVMSLQKPWTSVTSFHSSPTSSVHSVSSSAKFQTV